ncbi:hypothetical protein AGOR_G00251510 [Albula goreensis]|uniref:Uncharacterized protein n=1 Tax=Albula goreensis TaxID=1534307 RepID=A0A8T3CEQ4_9TELE|nr:hypothetical protein AGOR_G00251510 [Albula goreensis]
MPWRLQDPGPNGHAKAAVDVTGDGACYSPVSLEQDPTVNNGSGVLRGPHAITKDPAVQIDDQPSTAASCCSPGEPLRPRPPPHFQRPYRTRTSMQGDVYNFLERPAGLRCFLYHFLV